MKRHCILDRDSISRLAAEICTLPWLGGEYSEMQMACTFILPPFLSLWRGRRSTPVSNLFVHFWVMVPHGAWSSPVWLAGYFLSSVVSEHSSTAGFYVGSEAWTQVLRLARQALYPVSCLPQTFLSTTILFPWCWVIFSFSTPLTTLIKFCPIFENAFMVTWHIILYI